MNEDGIGKGKIGLTTFITSPVPHNKCGSDGLPVTPNSIKVLGRAQCLKALRHKHLCKYLDFCRGKHDRIFCISEYHEENVLTLIPKQRSAILNEWYRVVTKTTYEILDGLVFLDSHGIVHHNLHPTNVLLNSEGSVKLYAYGLYYMTDAGQEVSFPVGCHSYLSPEELLFTGEQHENDKHFPSGNIDVWALGIICLELCLGHQIFPDKDEVEETCKKILGFLISGDDVVPKLVKYSGVENAEYIYQKLPDSIKMFIETCLTADPLKRPTPKELFGMDLFSELREKNINTHGKRSTLFSTGCDCSGLRLPTAKEYATSRSIEPLLEREYSEIWHLWKLAGGDVFSEVRKSNTVHSVPPILNLPLSMSLHGEVISLDTSIAHLYDSSTIVLSLDALRNRLKDVTPESYYPLLENKQNNGKEVEDTTALMKDTTSSLPLVIKENDIEYQLHRIILYKRLLLGYPYLRERIWKEARIDIPPHLRGLVWAALLDVTGDVKAEYENIDKETPLSSDRQIAVDIPRCHQYDPLLSSPVAHKKFKRILKAWLKSHPTLSYWQGLDSLCAAFLHLNFNTEHLAWASMSNYIDKYLYNFFLKDNSAIIQEYLAVFRHLIAFHEPELANHLEKIGFIPELYSIPWFLTMFTHVFPLHKIVHLWDTLLLGNSSFPLCVGVAILKQLKSQLMTFDFNECILMFSDLPEIDIDAIVQISIQLFCATPRSATYRKHAKRSSKSTRKPVSYYTEDYNTIPHDELSMSEVSLEDLKCEISPRISADDMIQLCELKGPSHSKTPAKRSAKNAKPKITILDVRSPDEFHRAAIPGSHNIPYQTCKNPDGSLNKSLQGFQTIDQFKPRLIIVVGNKQSREDAKFASLLVNGGYRGVLVLHQGIDVFKPTGLLTIQ
uniref:TBC domain-containing protein kinase-like protein n=1 Tax=Styela clava TaxID=7725 RepID=UPI00193ABA3A|nr:TBC domain-containing protein kinase-like protein [Styela clava]